MKKYFFTLLVLAVFSIGFVASDEYTGNDESLVGNYVVTDSEGTKWYFNFTNDKNVTVKAAGMSDDEMYHGSRSIETDGYYSLYFDDYHGDNPPIAFPNGKSVLGDYLYITKDGWLYHGYDYLRAKNPKARLKVTEQ